MTTEPSLDLSGAAVAGPFDGAAAELRRWSVGTLVGLLLLTALLLAWRRLAGALSTPLEPSALLAVGGLAATAALGIRLLWHSRGPAGRPPARNWPAWIPPSLALVLLAAALSLPSTTAAGMVALWTPLAAEEFLAWGIVAWRAIRSRRKTSAGDRRCQADTPQEESLAGSPSTDDARPFPPVTAMATEASVAGGDVLQQLTRSRAKDGSEQLAGYVRTRFDPGQRTASIHVAFCPPFVKTPELTIRELDGPSARVKTSQLVPYGARLDLKLAAATDQPKEVVLEFLARSAGE